MEGSRRSGSDLQSVDTEWSGLQRVGGQARCSAGSRARGPLAELTVQGAFVGETSSRPRRWQVVGAMMPATLRYWK